MRVPVLVGVRVGVHEVAMPVRMRMHVRVDVGVLMFVFMLVGMLPLGPVVVVRVFVRQAFAIRHRDPPRGNRSSIGYRRGLRNPLALASLFLPAP